MALLEDWNDIKEKDNKNKNIGSSLPRKLYEIPARNVNYFHGFNFKTTDPATDGILFLVFILFIPFLSSILIYTLFFNSTDNNGSLAVTGITLVSAIIGFFLSFVRVRDKLWKDNIAFAYLFIIIPQIMVILVSLILSSIVSGKSDLTINVVNGFASQTASIIAEVSIIILYFTKTGSGLQTFKLTIKQNWKMLLIVTVIFLVAMIAIAQGIFSYGYSKLFNIKEDSNNQKELVDLVNNNNIGIRVSYDIVLFVSAVLIAPLCEEMCTRSSFFSNVGNKWVGLGMSTLYFGFIHCGITGDFAHLPSYIAAGLILSSVFVVARGNFVYSWATHLSSNLVSIILIFATGGRS